MKSARLFSACALAVALLVPVGTATAQFGGVRVGSHAGVNFDGTDFFIGLNSHFGVSAGETQLVGNPSVDFYLFEDNVSIYSINLDVLYPLTTGSLNPFFGAGLAIRILKFDEDIPALGGNSDSDVGLNLRAGSFFGDPESSIRMFGDVGLTLGDGTAVSARVGASFGITG